MPCLALVIMGWTFWVETEQWKIREVNSTAKGIIEGEEQGEEDRSAGVEGRWDLFDMGEFVKCNEEEELWDKRVGVALGLWEWDVEYDMRKSGRDNSLLLWERKRVFIEHDMPRNIASVG